MSKIPSPITHMEKLASYLGDCIFSCSIWNCIFLFWFGLRLFHLFTSQFQIWIFCYTFTYFVPFGAIKNRVTKVNFEYFNGNFAEAWLFEKFIFELDASSYSFKITCILSRQVISLKKMVVSSAKFTILISWSPICIPLILLLALMKLASTSAAIMYKTILVGTPGKPLA